MKKIYFLLTCLIVAFVSCTNEDLNTENGEVLNSRSPEHSIRWYGTKTLDSPQTKGVADQSKLWNANTPIRVKFLNEPEDPAILEKIETYAKEWEKYAGIRFDFVPDNEEAVVRIGFDWEYNDWLTWSLTGNDAKMIFSQNQPTAVFGGIQYLSEEELKGDVLRVFGQILGLEYEQRHLGWDDSWWKKDKNGVYRAQQYWENMFEDSHFNFDWEIIRKLVFDPMASPAALQTEEPDMESIMLWPHYTLKETSKLVANYELSEKDKEFIATLYPKKEELPTIQTAWIDAGFMEWQTKENTHINDWYEGLKGIKLTKLGREQEYLPDVCDGEQLNSAMAMFSGATQLKKVPYFNSSNIEDFGLMFADCHALTEIPFLDTSKGTNFIAMFYNCHNLESVTNIDTSNGIYFGQMFFECNKLSHISIDTSKGDSFKDIFRGCSSLLSIKNLNLSSVPDNYEMSWFLDDAINLTEIKIEGIGASYETEEDVLIRIASPVLSINSLESIIDLNPQPEGKTFTIYLNIALESKVDAALLAKAEINNIILVFEE